MIFYTVGVSIAGFSTNIDFLLIARGFQGVGLSMFPIAFSIVRAQFPRQKMAIGQVIITSMYGGGAVIGLSIGGTIIQHYQLAFYIFHTNTNCPWTCTYNLAFHSCRQGRCRTKKKTTTNKYSGNNKKQKPQIKQTILNI